MVEERRDHKSLGYNWQPRKDAYRRGKDRRMIIPLGLSNFVSVGILDPNLNEATAQAALHSGSPLPSEEWVSVEDWYSDEEQSETDTVQISKDAQPDPPAP